MRKVKRTAALIQAIITIVTVLFNVMPVSAFGAEEVMQTITAELFTDGSYSESLLSDTVITLTGDMPEEASVKGYPVSCDIEGMETIAAYDITIFENDGETVFQPSEDKSVNVTFSIPELGDTEDIAVFHIDGEGNQNEISDVVADSETVSFEAESFSVYVISKHEQEEEPVVPRVEFHFLSDNYTQTGDSSYISGTYTFPNTDNEYQHSQILLDGETLQFIDDPKNHTDEEGIKSYFYGWYVVNKTDFDEATGETTYSWHDEPVRISFEEAASISFEGDDSISCTLGSYSQTLPVDTDGCAHVYLAPIYSDYYFINFLNNNETNDSNSSLSLLESKLVAFGADGKAEARIGNISAPSPDPKHKVFIGWKRLIPRTPDDDEHEETYITVDDNGGEVKHPDDRDGYYIDCSINEMDEHNHINLYPVFAEARWINYQHDEGATYVGSKYLLTSDEGHGTTLTSCPVPKKVGFDFLGWYNKADGRQITDADGNLINGYSNDQEKISIENGEMKVYRLDTENTDINLYPKWEEKTTAKVTINIWKQMSTDEANLADSEKHYDYVESVERNLPVGATLNAVSSSLSDLTGRSYTGFHYQRNNMIHVVKNEDSTGEDDKYKEEKLDKVSSDGQAIINIYYDRDVHNLYFQDHVYTRTTNTGGTTQYYGFYENQYVPIYRNNGVWYRTRTPRGWSYNYSDPYVGDRYTRSNDWQTIKTITALYEHRIKDEFPIKGNNGAIYDNGERWQATSVYDNVLVRLDKMPDNNIVFHLDSGEGRPTKTMNYYVEALEGDNDPSIITYDGKYFKLYTSINAKYYRVTRDEDFSEIEGFTAYKSVPEYKYNSEMRTYTALDNINKDETIDMYYTRNNSYLTFYANYPTTDAALMFGGVPANDAPTGEGAIKAADETIRVPYEQNLAAYKRDYSVHAPDNYTFAGWYTDTTYSHRFDFDNSTMPVGNLRLYAKWEPVEFRIKIDPNGGIIDHIDHSISDYRTKIFGDDMDSFASAFPDAIEPFGGSGVYNTSQATYFNNSYNEEIKEYTLDAPMYIPISDAYAAGLGNEQIFYYMNMQFKKDIDKGGLPKDLRNALYLTEEQLREYYDNFYKPVIEAYKAANSSEYGNITIPSFAVWKNQYVSEQKYTNIANVTTNRYVFEGWYEVDENGNLGDMPFNFNTIVAREYSLQAVWRLKGGYTIIYHPTYDDGESIITGTMEENRDPKIINGKAKRNYADYADTTILRQPDNVTGAPDAEYIFRGWRLVGIRRSGTDEYEFYPLEPGVYYQPGEEFIIQSRYADSEDIIHMQAVYEKSSESYRRPDVSKLTLDANGGFLVDPTNNNARISEGFDLPWLRWYASDSIGNIEGKPQNDPPVSDYDQLRFHSFQSNAAVHLYKYATGDGYTADSGEGVNYFKHPLEYMLLGFDKNPDEGDFIATYAADGIISLQRNDDTTLYAVWEPTVYLNLENKTEKEITFALTASDTQTLYIVNQATSLYDRVKVVDLSNITIQPGETLRFAVPYGENKDIAINGVNQLGKGNLLKITSYLPDEETREYETHKGPEYTDNGQPFVFSENLIKDRDGVKIVFEPEKSKYVLLLDDPTRNTGVHEFDFTDEDLEQPFELSETRSSTGYIFKGWANSQDATTPDYAVTDTSQMINPLNVLFNGIEADENQIKTKTLYAVWEVYKEAGKFHVYKEAQLPCDPNKEFEFTVVLDASYTYGNNRSGTVTKSGTFKLKNGEYLEIHNDINYDNSPHIQLNVQRYNINGQPEGGPSVITSSLAANAHISITSYKVTVTEEEYANFDTTASILADTTDDGYSAHTDGDRAFYWNDPNAGGTALFTNNRKTAPVTIVKELIAPDNYEAGKEFHFNVELVDPDDPEEKDYSYTLSTDDFAIANGYSFTLEDLPVNAILKITEEDEKLQHTVEPVSENGSEDMNDSPRIFEFKVPETGDTITYKNTLRETKIALYSYSDDDGVVQPFNDAYYHVSGNDGTLLPNSDGLFYTKDPMYYSSITVTQDWCSEEYEQITEPMTFSVEGTEDGGTIINSNVSNYRAEYDEEHDTWKIYIYTYKKMVAPTGVGDVPTGALALTAIFTLMFCTAFVYINSRRKGVE